MRPHVRVMVPLLAMLGGCGVEALDPTTASLRNAIVGMDGGLDADVAVMQDTGVDAPELADPPVDPPIDPPDDPDEPDAAPDAGDDTECPMCCEIDGHMTVCPCRAGGPPTGVGDMCTTDDGCSGGVCPIGGEGEVGDVDEEEDDWDEWCAMLHECDYCEWLHQCRPQDWQCLFADSCLEVDEDEDGEGEPFVTPTCPRSPLACPAFAHGEDRGPPRGRNYFENTVTQNFSTPWMYLTSGAALGCDALALAIPLLLVPTPLTVGLAVGIGAAAIVFNIASIVTSTTTETNRCTCAQEYDIWGKAYQEAATNMVSAFCWRCVDEACTERRCSSRAFPDGCAPNFPNTEEISECCHDNFKVDTLQDNVVRTTTCTIQANPTTDLPMSGRCHRWLEYRCNNGNTPYRCGGVIRCPMGPSTMCVLACQNPEMTCTELTGMQGCTTVERQFCPPSCFEAGTPITMADGSTKPIEQIREGDLVLSYDVSSGATTPGFVERTFVHEQPVEPTIVINGTLRATRNHPFYRDGGWVEAGDLRLGDQLLIATSPRTVERHRIQIITIEPPAPVVYNFEVAGQHNYFAGGILSHNKPL